MLCSMRNVCSSHVTDVITFTADGIINYHIPRDILTDGKDPSVHFVIITIVPLTQMLTE